LLRFEANFECVNHEQRMNEIGSMMKFGSNLSPTSKIGGIAIPHYFCLLHLAFYPIQLAGKNTITIGK
jgi:hypothetical protein